MFGNRSDDSLPSYPPPDTASEGHADGLDSPGAELNGSEVEHLRETVAAPFSRREKTLLILGAILALLAFSLAGVLFRIPAYPSFAASLLQQPTVISSLVVILIVYAVMTLCGSLVSGSAGFDAGIFCSAIGLCAVSVRGGPIRATLHIAEAPEIWTWLALETAILGGVTAIGWLVQTLLHRAGLLHVDSHRHVVTEVHESIDQKLLALIANVVLILAMLSFMGASDRKSQMLISVGAASFLGTLAAYFLVPTQPSVWYWSAPLLAGIVGYLMQYFGRDAAWQIGQVRGMLSGVARALPLDYAGSGVAAAVLGYWMSRRWQHQREAIADTATSD